jgi:hypothetical protein
MAFNKDQARLTDAQLATAEAIDKIYEVSMSLSGGVKFRHLLSVPQLIAPMSQLVKIISRAKGVEGLISLLLGAAAAFNNDNEELKASLFKFEDSDDIRRH